jgi:dTDP-4-amino-4,6-dideoxygalactose transaminase
VLRNHPTGVLTEAVYECMRQRLQHCFLFRAPTEHINRISANLGHLQEIILQRRTNSGLYERYLNWGATLKLYCFHPGAVPWRYNILVDEAHKPRLTKQLLQQQLAVSDWYPVIAPVFGVKETFPQAYRMEKQLLNFPLVDVTKDQIQRIAQEINRFFAAT